MDFNFQEPSLNLQKLLFNHKKRKPNATEALLNHIVEKDMYDFYIRFSKKGLIDQDDKITKKLLSNKEEKITKMMKQKEKDPENATHITAINISIAEYLAQVGDIEKAVELMNALVRDDASLSLCMDVELCKIRLAILTSNKRMLESAMKEASDICDHGCDWDRRNKFKVYRALYCLMSGKFDESALLISETLMSFDASEVVDYNNAVLYLVFCGLLTFDRSNICTRILECGEVIEVNNEKALRLVKSLYDCNYYDFLLDLYYFAESIEDDIYLSRFIDHFCKEMKLIAYKQILLSYRSLSLDTMAHIFGVSVDFLEQDVANFVVEGRLSCKIDRISGNILRDESVCGDVGEVESRGGNLMRLIRKNIE